MKSVIILLGSMIVTQSCGVWSDAPINKRELAVATVLEGSVRRAGDQVRINVQLIDAITGGHLWAERYDGTLADIFVLQDRVTEKIVSALAVKLTFEDRKALKHSGRPLNLDAYEYVLRGRAKLAQANRQATIEARKLFEKAIEADPEFARAYGDVPVDVEKLR